MTTYKSDAVTSGIMPDHARAGVVLNRTASYSPTTDVITSGDTLQMVPIPKYAKLLRVDLYHTGLQGDITTIDVGWGGDPNGFFEGIIPTVESFHTYPTGKPSLGATCTLAYYDNTAGFLHMFTADDTIDISFPAGTTSLETDENFQMSVWYKMCGTIADETGQELA
jgi:hypothetical protein